MTDHDPYGDPTRVEPALGDATRAMPTIGGEPPTGGLPPVYDPPPGNSDRRWLILLAVLAAALLVGVLALLLGGGDDDTATDDTTSTTLEETTTTSSTTTTEATTTSSTSTTAATQTTVAPEQCRSGGPNDADYSVKVLYKAYTLRDRSCAEAVATDEAVSTLFSIRGNGGGWTYQGCEEQDIPDPHLSCAYTFDGGATHFRTSHNDVDGWVIYDVFQTTD